MKVAVCPFLIVSCLQVYASDIFNFPDLSNVGCLSSEESAHISEYNKVEIINNLQRYPLADLLSQRSITPEDNPKLNQFLHCVWKKENYLTGSGDINYFKLEEVVTDAIVRVVGHTGPAIHLSTAHAMLILDECKMFEGLKIENRIAKVQNYIVNKLQPFSKI